MISVGREIDSPLSIHSAPRARVTRALWSDSRSGATADPARQPIRRDSRSGATADPARQPIRRDSRSGAT
ncbi:MAG: hypothetical protein ACRDMX_02835, partial [Solirubrobacteraceae bacterium]